MTSILNLNRYSRATQSINTCTSIGSNKYNSVIYVKKIQAHLLADINVMDGWPDLTMMMIMTFAEPHD